MHTNKKRAAASLALAAIIPLSFALSACSSPAYEETGNTVTFNYNDGRSRPLGIVAEEGSSVDKPATPVRKGYTFENWYTEKDGGTVVQFPYTPSGDVTLYAHWGAVSYDVTFDFNDPDEPGTTVVSAAFNSEIDAPDAPTRDGYNFRYWQSRPDGGNRIKFPYTVAGDVTFYARWLDAALSVFNVTVDYGYDDAPVVEPIEVEEGSALDPAYVSEPTRVGYKFLGWTTERGGTNYISFDTPYVPTSDVTFYANWKVQVYNITFDVNYIDAEENVYHRGQYPGGGDVNAPDGTPTRAGYTFDGWFASDRGGDRIEFPVKAARNTTYYAHWTKTPITPNRNIFDAEFTYINPTEVFPGYSGSATGIGIIVKDDTASAHSEEYPLNSKFGTHLNHYVSFLYKPDAKLTFVINSDRDVANATLYASLAYEIYDGGSLTIAPGGDFGFGFIVNGKALDYSPVTISGPDVNGGAGQFKSTFKEYRIAAGVPLKKGENVIVLAVNNNNPCFGGILTSAGPMVDYIRWDTDAKLTWSPVYDNVYQE